MTADDDYGCRLRRRGVRGGHIYGEREDTHGKTVNDTGKYVCVWKKQADGSWKAEVDTWNSDLPVVAAAPVGKKKG